MSFSHFSTVPIELLPGIGPRTATVLHKLDIRTVGQFKNTSEKILVELFGPSIRSVHHFVQGTSRSLTSTSASSNIKSLKTPRKRTSARFKKTMKVAALTLTML